MNNTIGLIPAAGKGLRLGLPYPKELYPIIRDNRYKPVAQYVVENMVLSGVQHVVFVINETKHQVLGYFGDGSRFGCQISYVVQEIRESKGVSTSPGLAHALQAAYHLTAGKRVCFGMADTIMTPENVFTALLQRDSDLVLGVYPTNTPHKFGMVDADPDGKVNRIVDKPSQTSLTGMWGCMVWQPIFTEHLKTSIENGIFDFAKILNAAIETPMSVQAVPLSGTYTDLGTYEEIAELEKVQRTGGLDADTAG